MQRITPHVDIYTEDESGIAFSILHLQSGFACLNYVNGYEKKITSTFHYSANATVVAKYVADCLPPTATYIVSTNVGTLTTKVGIENLKPMLQDVLEYIQYITLSPL